MRVLPAPTPPRCSTLWTRRLGRGGGAARSAVAAAGPDAAAAAADCSSGRLSAWLGSSEASSRGGPQHPATPAPGPSAAAAAELAAAVGVLPTAPGNGGPSRRGAGQGSARSPPAWRPSEAACAAHGAALAACRRRAGRGCTRRRRSGAPGPSCQRAPGPAWGVRVWRAAAARVRAAAGHEAAARLAQLEQQARQLERWGRGPAR